MGGDFKKLILVNEPLAIELKREYGLGVAAGSWLQVNALDRIDTMSADFDTISVEWAVSTVVDSLSITAWAGGQQKRSITYEKAGGALAAGPSRWRHHGKPLPFENTAALKRWLRLKRVDVADAGYELLEAFLGAPWNESTILANPLQAPASRPGRFSAIEVLDMATQHRDWATVAKVVNKRSCRERARELFMLALSDPQHDERARQFVKAGFSSNTRSFYGTTPLHEVRSKRAVELLVELGASVDAWDKMEHLTPLLAALKYVTPGTEAYVEALLNAGADPRRKHAGQDGLSLLQSAAHRDPFLAPTAATLETLVRKSLLVRGRRRPRGAKTN